MHRGVSSGVVPGVEVGYGLQEHRVYESHERLTVDRAAHRPLAP